MQTIATLFLSALLATPAASTANLAHSRQCDRDLTHGVNGLNFDPPRNYDTMALARVRAIAGWQQKVAALCVCAIRRLGGARMPSTRCAKVTLVALIARSRRALRACCSLREPCLIWGVAALRLLPNYS